MLLFVTISVIVDSTAIHWKFLLRGFVLRGKLFAKKEVFITVCLIPHNSFCSLIRSRGMILLFFNVIV